MLKKKLKNWVEEGRLMWVLLFGELISFHCFLLQEPSGVVIQILQKHILI
jgi:uncharacterized membrane protein YczE